MNSEETFSKTFCCYCLWNVKVSCKTLPHFSNIFFKLSTRNTAELLVLLSQIQLSDSMENGSISNKCFPTSLDTQQIPKTKWFIMCPSVPSDFLVALAIKHCYIGKFLPGSIWLYLAESEHLSLWLKVSIMQPDYSASIHGDERAQKSQPGLGLCDPVSKNKCSVLSQKHWYRTHSPGATKSIWLSLLKQSRPCSHPPAEEWMWEAVKAILRGWDPKMLKLSHRVGWSDSATPFGY